MLQIPIKESVKVAWTKFMERPWYLLGIFVTVTLLSIAGSSEDIMFTALSFIIMGGYILLLVMHYDGKKVEFDDLFSLDNRWISYVFASVIKMFLIVIGLLLFIIPGIYLAIRFMFVELLVIDKGMRPMEALRASSEMTKGNIWALLGFSIVLLLLVIAGLLFFVVGVLPASIIVTLATIHMYRTLSKKNG